MWNCCTDCKVKDCLASLTLDSEAERAFALHRQNMAMEVSQISLDRGSVLSQFQGEGGPHHQGSSIAINPYYQTYRGFGPESQKEVGSLLWLVTKTCPDLMYAVSKMSALSTKDPAKALEIAQQIKGYVKGTIEDGLVFRKKGETSGILNAYSHASFAPGGDCSHRCSMVLLQRTLILWKSSRQPMVTLSTAEAELLEVVESLTMGVLQTK